MMMSSNRILAVTLAALAMVGCKKQSKPPAPAQPTGSAPVAGSAPTAESVPVAGSVPTAVSPAPPPSPSAAAAATLASCTAIELHYQWADRGGGAEYKLSCADGTPRLHMESMDESNPDGDQDTSGVLAPEIWAELGPLLTRTGGEKWSAKCASNVAGDQHVASIELDTGGGKRKQGCAGGEWSAPQSTLIAAIEKAANKLPVVRPPIVP